MDHYSFCTSRMLEAGFLLETDNDSIEDIESEFGGF